MRCGVMVYPGSNCDHDVYHVLKHVLRQDTLFLWHEDTNTQDCELVVIPGGFSFGDYLRAGALAAHSPVMKAMGRHVAAGGLLLGICNGFQILLEAGLLPGAMRRNQSLRFECRDVHLRVENNQSPFTHRYEKGEVLSMPIAHAEGCYTAPDEVLDELEANGQVVFRYVNAEGEETEAANINGSARSIAGIMNAEGNVLGMMPHPERAAEAILGRGTDGLALFQAAISGAIETLGGKS